MGIGPLSLRTLPRTADEVISMAKCVVTTVRDLQDREVSPLPDADRLIESLSQAIGEAQTQLDEARNAAADAQDHAQRIRDAATALQAELVSLRKVLRSLLGSRHVDYQTLRSERGAYHEEGGDPVRTFFDRTTGTSRTVTVFACERRC